MITCPRCGFVQPEDRFCAQCGVDMERYKPSTKPFLERFTSSILVQLLVILGLVGSTTYVIYSRKRTALNPKLQTTSNKIGFAQNGSNPQPAPARPASQLPANSAVADVNRRNVELAKTQVEATKDNAKNADGSESSKEDLANDAKLTLNGVKVTALGVPMAHLATLTDSAKGLGSSGTVKGYWIKNWAQSVQKLRDNRGDVAELESSMVSLVGAPATWDRMTLDPTSNHEVGLSILVTPNAQEPARFAVKIERHLRDPRSTVNGPQDTLTWTLDNLTVAQAGEALLLMSVLPRRKLTTQEELLFAPTFLRIMNTSEFQSGYMDVGLLVEPQLQP